MARCPLCNKNFADLLMHLVFSHDIEDIEHFNAEVKSLEIADRRRRDFHGYVTQLQDQRRRGVISAEQYRELVSKWIKEHPQEKPQKDGG